VTGQERRAVSASGSISIDLTKFAEYVATLTASRVIAYLNSRPATQSAAFRPVEPAPATDPALRERGEHD
jgi:hypothetical protein